MVIPRSRSAFSLSKTQATVELVIRGARSDGERQQRTILEGALAELSGFLLELFDGTLIDTTALVDQVSSGGGLSGIDVSDDCGGKKMKHQTRFDDLSKTQTETHRRR
jgi:hypothetical protein